MTTTQTNLIKHFSEHVIKLAPLELIPLSSQLQRITGDPYSYIDFINQDDEGLNAKSGTVIIHIKTGLQFLIP